jgi:hypothetical protein
MKISNVFALLILAIVATLTVGKEAGLRQVSLSRSTKGKQTLERIMKNVSPKCFSFFVCLFLATERVGGL